MTSALKNLGRRCVPRSWRHFVRHPWISVSARAKRMMGRMGKKMVCEPLPGWRFSAHPEAAGFFEMYRRDEELQEEMRSFAATCHDGMTLVDLGCHYGLFTLLALHVGGARARILAVDPSPDVAEILACHVKWNDADRRIIYERAAAGAACLDLPMLSTGAGGAGFFVPTDATRPDHTLVPCYTVGALCEKHNLVPSHLKIDVEAFEREVLLGAADFLRRHQPVLFFELHSQLLRERGIQPQEVLETLRECHYPQFWIGGQLLSEEALLKRSICRFIALPSGKTLDETSSFSSLTAYYSELKRAVHSRS